MIIPPLVFSFGVKGKTKSLQPLGSGNWDVTSLILSAFKASFTLMF